MKRKIIISIITVGIILTLVVLIAGLGFSLYIAANVDREIDETLFEVLTGNTGSSVYYYESEEDRLSDSPTLLEDGELYGGYRSIPITYEEVPQELIYAFVSIEDKRFFEHGGVDFKRTLGAGLNYFLNFREEFGGSTITQQLIKNVTGDDDYSLLRKVREMLWAIDLERKMSKDEILESYLNIINLSNGCYGVGAASEYYFSKTPSELTLAECASIAAITNNPSYYNPIRNPKNNQARRNLILSEMLAQGYISESEYNEAVASEVELVLSDSGSSINLWYTDMVIDDVVSDLVAERGYTRDLASHMIYTGGLKIYTAMDRSVQELLEEYYADTKNFYSGDGTRDGAQLQSSMIIIDPYSGDILGVAGAVGSKQGNRVQNFATGTLRPAGSVIKPLSVYAPAIENGVVNYASVYDDVPVDFVGSEENPTAWPKNANGVYRGLTNINYAVEHSVNTVTVRVLDELGLTTSFDFLKNKLHMDSLIYQGKDSEGRPISDCDYAALALGQFNFGVSLCEITTAYSVFPSGGIYSHARSYYKVTDKDGNILLDNTYQGEEVISEDTASIMNKMLQNVTENGTATGITLKEKLDCAGKTGTTQNNYDRWYIGYTPYLLGGVWFGYDYPKETDSATKGICIKVWDEIMTKLHNKYLSSGEVKEFAMSENIVEAEYCVDSGKLISEACRRDARGDRSETGYFVRGSEPNELCTTHVLVEYDTSGEGGIADSGCSPLDCEYVGLIKVERSFPTQIYVTDAQYVYREVLSGIMPETNPNLPFFATVLGENEYTGISYGGWQYNRYCRAHLSLHGRREE